MMAWILARLRCWSLTLVLSAVSSGCSLAMAYVLQTSSLARGGQWAAIVVWVTRPSFECGCQSSRLAQMAGEPDGKDTVESACQTGVGTAASYHWEEVIDMRMYCIVKRCLANNVSTCYQDRAENGKSETITRALSEVPTRGQDQRTSLHQ
jgi:hypothetical protein